MGDGRFVCVVSPTFRNRRCGSGAVTMAAGVSYVGCCSRGVLPVTGGGLFLRANYKRSTTWYSPLGKPARPDLIVCVFFLAHFESQHRIATPTPKQFRTLRTLAGMPLRRRRIVFSYRYDSFINTTNALHATCLHKQRSSTTNPLPPRFHHVRRHSIHTDNVALAMFR